MAKAKFDASPWAHLGLPDNVIEKLHDLNTLPVLSKEPVPTHSSGVLVLDMILGGGWKKGSFNTVTGSPGSGKSTICLFSAWHQTQMGNKVAWFDMENAFNPMWAEKLGINMDLFHIFKPRIGEEMCQVIADLIPMNAYELIVIDSIGYTPFKAEAEARMSDNHMAVAARMWSKWSRIITWPLRQSNTVILGINKLYHDPGNAHSHGQPTKEYGGDALLFLANARLNMQNPKRAQNNSWVMFRPRTLKNRLRQPYMEAEFTCYYDGGDFIPDLVDSMTVVGKDLGVFTDKNGNPVSGSQTWHFEGTPLAVGQEKVKAILYEDSGLSSRVYAKIRAEMEKLQVREEKQEKVIDVDTGEISGYEFEEEYEGYELAEE